MYTALPAEPCPDHGIDPFLCDCDIECHHCGGVNLIVEVAPGCKLCTGCVDRFIRRMHGED